MSDAQETTVQSDDRASLVANPPVTSHAARPSTGRLIRLLATVGALVFGYAVWLPWAIITTTLDGKPLRPVLVDPAVAITSNLVRVGDLSLSPFVLAAFSMLGLLLAPLLWRPADSLLGAIASHLFGLWVIFATILVVVFGISPLVSGTAQPVSPLPPDSTSATRTGMLALGFWVAAVALVPLWIAVIGLLVSEWRRHAFWHLPGGDSDAPRSLIQLPGGAALNLGLIIWAVGFFSMGWAALNCSQTPLLLGSCQGIPASSALFAGLAQMNDNPAITSTTDPRILLLLDPGITRYAIGTLLGVGALLIFLGVWLRAVTRVFCIWTTLWLLATVSLAGIAIWGVGAIIAFPGRYAFPPGVWTAQSGIYITLLGLIIALVGLATLSVAALRRKAVE